MTPATYETRADGYCRWRVWDGERERYCYVHQLLAIAEGEDPADVFSDGANHVHHRSGIKYDNRPENLELLDSKDHGRETVAQTTGKAVATDGGEPR